MSSSIEICTFTFVIGMFLSYFLMNYYAKVPLMWSIFLAWQPMAVMQLFDVLILKEARDQEGSVAGPHASFFTIMLHPSLMGLLLLTREGIPIDRRTIATFLVIAHFFWYSYSISEVSSLDINAGKLPYQDFVFCFVTINMFLLLVEPFIDMALLLSAATILHYVSMYEDCGDQSLCTSSALVLLCPCLLTLYWERFHVAPEISIFRPSYYKY